jgi:hypothetical protein
MDMPQSLERSGIEDATLIRGQSDEDVNWISDLVDILGRESPEVGCPFAIVDGANSPDATAPRRAWTTEPSTASFNRWPAFAAHPSADAAIAPAAPA